MTIATRKCWHNGVTKKTWMLVILHVRHIAGKVAQALLTLIPLLFCLDRVYDNQAKCFFFVSAQNKTAFSTNTLKRNMLSLQNGCILWLENGFIARKGALQRIARRTDSDMCGYLPPPVAIIIMLLMPTKRHESCFQEFSLNIEKSGLWTVCKTTWRLHHTLKKSLLEVAGYMEDWTS